MKKQHIIISLIAILILATATQVYRLKDLPPGLFADEAVNGVEAYSILTKGTDTYGNSFPLFFRALGEYKSSVGIYTAIPFVAVFGLNEFAVRLTSVAFGLANIILIYFLVSELLRNHPNNTIIALTSSLFLAISPWHIHMSRIGWDAYTQLLFFAMLGTYLFLRAQKNPKLLKVSICAFALATYCYYPARIFVPLFGLGLLIIYFKFFLEHKKETLISFIILIILLTPLTYHLLSPEGSARMKQVSIFSHPPSDKTITDHVIDSYLGHFSFTFLFRKGDIDTHPQFVKRHSVRGMGELYLFQLPLVFIGAFALWNNKYRKVLWIIALWLLLFPLGTVFTEAQSPQATRSFVGVIPFQILSAVGLWAFLNFVSQKNKIALLISVIIVSLIIIASFVNYLNLYFVKYETYSADAMYGWPYGIRDIINHFMKVENDYDEMYMSPDFNGPEIFIPFYSQNFEKGCKKCKIGSLNDKYDPKKKQLFSVTPEYLSKSKYNATFEIKENVHYPNGRIAFVIGEIKN